MLEADLPRRGTSSPIEPQAMIAFARQDVSTTSRTPLLELLPCVVGLNGGLAGMLVALLGWASGMLRGVLAPCTRRVHS